MNAAPEGDDMAHNSLWRANVTERAVHAAQTALRASMLALIDSVGWGKTKLLQRHGFRRVWVNTSVGPVHVLDAPGQGAGATWVFIHGFASQAVDWFGLLRDMQPKCRRLIALDLPGHGHSPVSAAGLNAETLTEAGVQAIGQLLAPHEQIVLVGNSMGGLGAVRYAQRVPDRVLAMVLLSPAGAPMAKDEIEALLQVFNINSLASALQFVDKLFVNGCRARHITALGVMAHLNRPALQSLLEQYRTYPFLTRKEVSELPPCLLVWGAGDEFFPNSSKHFYSTALDANRSQVATPKEFGHTPFLDRPHDVARIVLDWAHNSDIRLLSEPQTSAPV
jgi:pimeloyl-ACP methyl ester carboxylesterase